MILLLLFSLSIELLLDLSLRGVFQSSSQVLQHFCVQQFSGEVLRPLAGALVCGSDLSGSPLKTLFIDTGIYHVLVVSGAHLGLFVFCFNFLVTKISDRVWIRVCISFFLFFYAFVTGLQAPVVRALVQYLMIQRNQHRVRPIDVLLSYIYCLVFEPKWIESLSLQLSTVATLAFIFPLTTFRKNLLIYFSILPLLLPMGVRSPMVTVIATLIGPLLEVFMLPIFLLAMIIKPIQPPIDSVLPIFLSLLENLRATLPPPSLFELPNFKYFGPTYILIIWLIAEHVIANKNREWHLREEECEV